MYMPAGTCYVYMTYGMYFCFNISTREPGAAVLLRALEPIDGIDVMQKYRKARNKNLTADKPQLLCNGPSKLCMAMDIKKSNTNKLDLCDSSNNNTLWIEEEATTEPSERKNDESKTGTSNKNTEMAEIIVKTSRIGIASAGEEWAKKELRFYILGNSSVSKRDKKAEGEATV